MNGLSSRTAPDDHSPLAAVARGAPQVRECLDRILEEHHAESRHDQVEAFRLERVGLRVGADEGRRHAFAVGRARAAASIGSEMSTPTQGAVVPSRRAIATVVLPVPQPTSSS